MIVQALRGLGSNRLRTALTALAIALSVGLVSGTFVMGDTINKTFSEVFSDATSGTDTRVQAVGFDNDDDDPLRVKAALVDDIRQVDGVAAVEPVLSRWGVAILDRDGDPLGGNGPPRFGWSWNENQSINPFDLREGRAPVGNGEVVIDATSADAADYAIGDTVGIAPFAEQAREYELVGIVGFGEEDNLAQATVALFSAQHSREVLNMGDEATFIDVVAEDGVSQQALTSRVGDALGDSGAEAITGQQAGENLLASVESDIALFRNVLLGFGSIALLVAAFTIFNTFAITVAQRTRHLALFRAVGASPAQVRRLVLAEAAILGLGASLIGLGLGVLLAIGLFELFGALGAALPSTDPVLATRTVWISLLVGVIATLVAALLPAWRASRVAPVAALQETAAESPRISRLARTAGIALPAMGAGILAAGLFGGYGLAAVLLGSLVVLIGATIALQQLARPVVAVLGAPLRRMGLTGQLARENAMRNPRRAAVTAGALMIGLALVSLASVFTASAKTSINEVIDERFAADFAVFSEDFDLDPAIADRLDSDPAFSAIARWRVTELIETSSNGREFSDVYGTDPSMLTQVYSPGVVEGDIVDLANGGVALQKSAAEDRGLAVGDTLRGELQTPAGPEPASLEVVAIYEDSTIGDIIISLPRYSGNFQDGDDFLLLKASPDVDYSVATASVTQVGRDYPTVVAQDRAEFKADAAAAADQLFTLILALLTLAIIIAVLGIVNTLALSVVERTREIGLLRAVGMSRRQVGRMIRGEAVLLALLGGVVGIAVGVGLAALMVPRVPDITVLEVPTVQLAVFLAACVVVGLVASLLPARRAARMDVLRAISSD